VQFHADDLLPYSRIWAQSIERLKLHGVIITNIEDKFITNKMKEKGIDLITISEKSPIFQNHADQTTVDMKFFVAQEWLKNNPYYKYVMITDLSDVEFLNNPFPFMQGYDLAMGQGQFYVGNEVNGSIPWMQKYWWNCWQETIPEEYFSKPFINPGVIGAKSSLMMEFLDAITRRLEDANRVYHHMSCDMQAAWTAVFDNFEHRTFSGPPFNTEYKADNPKLEGMLIRHK
jgi:hypothetical protein